MFPLTSSRWYHPQKLVTFYWYLILLGKGQVTLAEGWRTLQLLGACGAPVWSLMGPPQGEKGIYLPACLLLWGESLPDPPPDAGEELRDGLTMEFLDFSYSFCPPSPSFPRIPDVSFSNFFIVHNRGAEMCPWHFLEREINNNYCCNSHYTCKFFFMVCKHHYIVCEQSVLFLHFSSLSLFCILSKTVSIKRLSW